MTLKFKISAAFYLMNAVYFLIVGLMFVFRQEFFPFHSDVIQIPWSDLEVSAQTLYLGMMRTEGAGFLASGASLIILLTIPFRRKEVWASSAMTLIGVIEHLPTFLANLHVAQTSPASPPWEIALIGMFSLVLGLVLSIRSTKTDIRIAPRID